MKLLTLLVALFFAAGPAAGENTTLSDSEIFSSADWNWRKIGRRAQVGYAQLPLFNSMQSISVIRYKSSRYRTDVINDPAGDATTTSKMSSRHKALAAVNGSYFSGSLEPVTFIKEDGVIEGNTPDKESRRVNGVVAIRGRRVDIFRCSADEYALRTRRYSDVMAAGPLLLIDGAETVSGLPETGFYAKRHPRTIVGTTADGWVYFIVADGRFPGQADGLTIAEAATLAGMFGLDDAINLDGGGSSALWTEAYGVESYPCDNKRFEHNGERKIPNVLIIR